MAGQPIRFPGLELLVLKQEGSLKLQLSKHGRPILSVNLPAGTPIKADPGAVAESPDRRSIPGRLVEALGLELYLQKVDGELTLEFTGATNGTSFTCVIPRLGDAEQEVIDVEKIHEGGDEETSGLGLSLLYDTDARDSSALDTTFTSVMDSIPRVSSGYDASTEHTRSSSIDREPSPEIKTDTPRILRLHGQKMGARNGQLLGTGALCFDTEDQLLYWEEKRSRRTPIHLTQRLASSLKVIRSKTPEQKLFEVKFYRGKNQRVWSSVHPFDDTSEEGRANREIEKRFLKAVRMCIKSSVTSRAAAGYGL